MAAVALCILCHDRPDELVDALTSAQASAWDEIVVLDMASDPPLSPIPGVTWERSDVNVGVATGRNRLLAMAQSDVLVFLDDDAVFKGPVAEALLRRFEADPRLGVVALRAVRSDGHTESSEYPFRGEATSDQTPRPCTYFVGCGYAARRSALVEVGGYDESFFYSTEEVDLGLRLIRNGWTLLYDPTLVVEHRPSVRGRSLRPQVPAMRLRNRLLLVRRHFPVPVAVVHGAVWGARTLLEARAARGLKSWADAWRDGLRRPVDRQPLAWRDLVRIHRLGGRALW